MAINQSPERVRRYIAAHPVPHETFYDTEGKAAGAFDAPATSYVVVLDKTGKVVYTGLGGKQDLEAALRKGSSFRRSCYCAESLWRRRETVHHGCQLGVGGGVRTLNGLVTYATRPSGPTTNSDRLSTLFLTS